MSWGLDNLVDDAIELFEAPVREAANAVEAAAEAAKAAGEAAVQAIAEGIEAIEALGEDVLELLDDAQRALVEAAKALGRAVEAVADGIDAMVDKVEHGLEAIAHAVAGIAVGFDDLVAGALEWAEHALANVSDWVVDDLLPAGWGLLKLLAAVALLAAAAVPLLLTTLICNLVAEHYGHEEGRVIDAILRGDRRYREMYKIRRLPARGRYVITSDLHRWSAHDEQEAGFLADSRRLYERVLEFYGTRQEAWSLIENGDVEDYWLKGGTLAGVAYDMATLLPGPVLDAKCLDAGLVAAYVGHLRQVTKTHSKIYDRLRGLFDDKGLYFRTAGNHDDVATHPELVRALRVVLPMADVYDYIVLADDDGTPLAVVAHGHQTDAWNSGACSFLGRVTTSLASGVRDLAFGLKSIGVPGAEDRDKFWQRAYANRLDQIGPFGADTDLGSLDESSLFAAVHARWGDANRSLVAGPWFLLGHTHVPLSAPIDPEGGGVWLKYVNTGCGIFPGMVTAIEWVYTDPAIGPQVKLVGWRWARELDPTQSARAIRRRYLAYTDGSGDGDPLNLDDSPVPLGLT